jgi:hypothetical protein
MSEFFQPTNRPSNLHEALQYDEQGRAEMRVNTRINVENAEFSFGGTVSVDNFPDVQTVDGTIDVENWPSSQQVVFADGSDLGSFSRLRTTSTRLLGEFRTFYGTTGNIEMLNSTTGTASISSNLVAKFAQMSVGTSNGDRAVRQSRQYHPYIPGTSQLGLVSFCFQASKTNLFQGVGLYDDNDGIFFSMVGNTPTLTVRKGGVDTEIKTQGDWNVDNMDGMGPSGANLDFSTAQILVIDYQWLGVGRVRVGFDIDGQICYAHYFEHANSVIEPYTYQPSLPVRWEIKNTNNVVAPSSMKAICYSVYCEGEDYESGFTNAASNGQTPITVNNDSTNYGLIAVRLKNTVNGVPVKALARLKDWTILASNDIYYKVLVLLGASAISGSPSWSSATPTGWCEYTTNFTLSSDPPANSIILHEGYASGNNGNTGSINTIGTEARSATIYQNIGSTDSMIFAVVAYKINNNNASAYAALNWLEIK